MSNHFTRRFVVTLLHLPLLYLFQTIEFLSLVFVEFGNDIRECSFQLGYNDVPKSIYATTSRPDYPIENLKIAL